MSFIFFASLVRRQIVKDAHLQPDLHRISCETASKIAELDVLRNVTSTLLYVNISLYIYIYICMLLKLLELDNRVTGCRQDDLFSR